MSKAASPQRDDRNGPDDSGSNAEGVFPRRFGKYTLIRPLAVGGMAELFLALQKSTVGGFEKLIVVKRILPTLARDQAFAEMLLAEARIQATLNHPNIAHVYDVGIWEGQYYIAMEYLHGEDLRSIVRAMKAKNTLTFPLEHALAIALGCAAGLSFAHERKDLNGDPMNVVHRDVSPQNVLVTFNGDVKLVDFGIAKAGRSSMEDTKSGKLKGKIPYMSPEQAQGKPIDARTDVFALGILLFELVTGRRLFRGPNEFETLKMIVELPYPTPRSVKPEIDPKLEAIICKALEKDVDKRYQTARELQADLEAFVRGEQLAVSPLSVGQWMRGLFEEKLASQKEELVETRQLADAIAAEEEALERTHSSGVRDKKPSKLPWFLMFFLVAAFGVAAFFLMRRSDTDQAAQAPGVIAFTSDPPGAAIWIDGERRSERTPASVAHLPVGTYSVRMTSDGYVPFSSKVVVTSRDPRHAVRAVLARPTAAAYGVVRIQSTPPGARIFLDGHDTGRVTPATLSEITPDVEHAVSLTLDHHVSKQETFLVHSGEAQDIATRLTPAPLGPDEAILRVIVVPETARVSFDGAWHEGGSPYEFRVGARRYTLIAAQEDFETEERDVELAGGQRAELSITLARETRRVDRHASGANTGREQSAPAGTGFLVLDARPWCNVSIDGRAVGQTPIVNRELSAGRHRVSCANPDLQAEKNVIVEIRAGQTTRQRVSLE